MPKDTTRAERFQQAGDRLYAEKREHLRQIGEQLALLEENPHTPAQVTEGIHEHLCQLGSVIPLWHPRVLRSVYWILCEEAQKAGIVLTDDNYVGQHVENNPQEYQQETVN